MRILSFSEKTAILHQSLGAHPAMSTKEVTLASGPSPFHLPNSNLGARTQVYPTPNPASLVGRLTSDGVPRGLEHGKG